MCRLAARNSSTSTTTTSTPSHLIHEKDWRLRHELHRNGQALVGFSRQPVDSRCADQIAKALREVHLSQHLIHARTHLHRACETEEGGGQDTQTCVIYYILVGER